MHRHVSTRPFRALRWFLGRPLLPFLVQLAVLAPLILAPEPRRVVGGYLFFLPWLLPVFGLLSLPFVFAAFRAFRLDTATKRNHALEHATILELERTGGRRLAGRSSRTGFRVSGHVTKADVRKAFDRVRRTVRDGEPLAYVSPRCGSNVVTAIGAGLGLLLGLVVWSVAGQPVWATRASALVTIVAVFATLRHALGNLLQRRFFTVVDFEDVSLRDIRHVPPDLFDRGTVVFVETIVRARSNAK
jgi:hypothetical protein